MRDWLSCCVQRGDGIQYSEMLNVMYTRHDYIDKRERSREYHKYTLKERYCCTGPPSNATTLLTVLSWPEDCSDWTQLVRSKRFWRGPLVSLRLEIHSGVLIRSRCLRLLRSNFRFDPQISFCMVLRWPLAAQSSASFSIAMHCILWISNLVPWFGWDSRDVTEWLIVRADLGLKASPTSPIFCFSIIHRIEYCFCMFLPQSVFVWHEAWNRCEARLKQTLDYSYIRFQQDWGTPLKRGSGMAQWIANICRGTWCFFETFQYWAILLALNHFTSVQWSRLSPDWRSQAPWSYSKDIKGVSTNIRLWQLGLHRQLCQPKQRNGGHFKSKRSPRRFHRLFPLNKHQALCITQATSHVQGFTWPRASSRLWN